MFVTERMTPFLDHWICGVGSPVAEQLSVWGLFSMPILSLGCGVKVGGTGLRKGERKEEERKEEEAKEQEERKEKEEEEEGPD